MEQALTSFMVDLATDPRKLADYQKDREAYLAMTGLSSEACEAVLSGDHERVAKLVGAALGRPTIVMGKQKTTKKRKTTKRGGGKATKRKRG